MRVLVFLCILSSCYGAFWNVHTQLIGWVQSSGAAVALRCQGKPYTDAEISMYDAEVFFDVWMAGPIKTDRYGVCVIDGTKREISQIEPYLYIKHWCKRKGLSPINICIDLPSYCINRGVGVKQHCSFALELSERNRVQRQCKGERETDM